MIQAIKKLFGSAPPAQKMAGATFTIMGPLPNMSHCYALERTVRKLNLTGWMQLSNLFNIEMEVYGTFQAIQELLQQIDHGKILQSRPRYEMMWLSYETKYPNFQYRFFDPATTKSR